MPIYRYRCSSCNVEFEKLMSITQKCNPDTIIICPNCNSEECYSILSKTSFSLKGGGWYKDGYTKEDS